MTRGVDVRGKSSRQRESSECSGVVSGPKAGGRPPVQLFADIATVVSNSLVDHQLSDPVQVFVRHLDRDIRAAAEDEITRQLLWIQFVFPTVFRMQLLQRAIVDVQSQRICSCASHAGSPQIVESERARYRAEQLEIELHEQAGILP